MTERVKLSDIAARLGVGKSTVHRALCHDPRCRAETAERIRAVAEEMGYRPDPIFSTMGARRGRHKAEGVMLAYLTTSRRGFGKNLTAPLAENAARLGYRIETFQVADFAENPARLCGILYARGCAGILANSPRQEHAEILRIHDRFPIVSVGRGDPMPYNTVRPSILSAVHLAWERMHALGYRRIGAIIHRHDPPAEDDYSRLAGCLASPQFIAQGSAAIPPYTEAFDDYARLPAWLKRHRPDAILAFGSATYHQLRKLDVRVPDEMAFACLHLDPLAQSDPLRRQLAGISQNNGEIARASLNLIDQMIRHGERGIPKSPLHILVPPTWHEGASLPPCSSGKH